MPSVSVAHRSGAGTPLRSSAVTELVVAKATARQARKVQICAETVPAMKGSSARWSCDHSPPHSSIVAAQPAGQTRNWRPPPTDTDGRYRVWPGKKGGRPCGERGGPAVKIRVVADH